MPVEEGAINWAWTWAGHQLGSYSGINYWRHHFHGSAVVCILRDDAQMLHVTLIIMCMFLSCGSWFLRHGLYRFLFSVLRAGVYPKGFPEDFNELKEDPVSPIKICMTLSWAVQFDDIFCNLTLSPKALSEGCFWAQQHSVWQTVWVPISKNRCGSPLSNFNALISSSWMHLQYHAVSHHLDLLWILRSHIDSSHSSQVIGWIYASCEWVSDFSAQYLGPGKVQSGCSVLRLWFMDIFDCIQGGKAQSGSLFKSSDHGMREFIWLTSPQWQLQDIV